MARYRVRWERTVEIRDDGSKDAYTRAVRQALLELMFESGEAAVFSVAPESDTVVRGVEAVVRGRDTVRLEPNDREG